MHRERDRWAHGRGQGRTQSYHADKVVKPEVAARQNAAAKQYRAALDALFEKKPEASERIEKLVPGVALPRVVESPKDGAGSQGRQNLLRRIQLAQGSKAISEAIDDFLEAGHELPDDQDVLLQMLEHRDESRVRQGIGLLTQLLAGQVARRKPVLVQRLKRIEELADEAETREAAAALRRITV